MQKWEYKRVTSHNENVKTISGEKVPRGLKIDTALKELGSHGWEMVSFTQISAFNYSYVFKRPIEE